MRSDTKMALIVLALALAMPVVARYAFKMGFKTGREMVPTRVLVVPGPKCEPPTPGLAPQEGRFSETFKLTTTYNIDTIPL